VASVLEGSSVLSGVNSQLVGKAALVDDFVFMDGGGGFVALEVNESRGWVVSVEPQVVVRDVVTNSESAVAVVSLDARFVGTAWQGPVEVVGGSSRAVSKVVLSVPLGLNASGGSGSPG